MGGHNVARNGDSGRKIFGAGFIQLVGNKSFTPNIISMSWMVGYNSTLVQAMKTALNEEGIILVAGVGNI